MCVFLVWLRVSTFNKEFYDDDELFYFRQKVPLRGRISETVGDTITVVISEM